MALPLLVHGYIDQLLFWSSVIDSVCNIFGNGLVTVYILASCRGCTLMFPL